MARLNRAFFIRDTVEVACDLLGCVLVREIEGQRLAGRIVETEAYTGWDDRASHGHRGKTARNAVMFGEPGFSYVYFIYGMYWLLNIVAKPPAVDYPAAVLLRALEPLEGLQHIARRREGHPPQKWTSGPGRLTTALDIDRSLNATDITAPASPLYIEAGDLTAGETIASGARVGIRVPEPWRSQPWRYWIAGNAYVSQQRAGSAR
jgi:DNA-3-methyladenine glycosylase